LPGFRFRSILPCNGCYLCIENISLTFSQLMT
jgi:hypothetical protein